MLSEFKAASKQRFWLLPNAELQCASFNPTVITSVGAKHA